MKERLKKLSFFFVAALLSLVLVTGCARDPEPEPPPTNIVDPTPPDTGPGDDVAGPVVFTYGVLAENATRDDILAQIATLPAPSGTVTFGDGTHPDANIGLWGWSNPSPNHNARLLMHGPGTVIIDFNGMMSINPLVVREYSSTDNADGSRDVRMSIHEDLRFSDGTQMTARDFLFTFMLYASSEMLQMDMSSMTGFRVVGHAAYRAGETRYFAGLRLYDEFTFGKTIDASHLPFFFEMLFFSMEPLPMHVIAPGVTMNSGPNGVYFCDNWNFALLQETVNNPVTGYRFNPQVVGGAYTFHSFDELSQILILEANPYFVGTFDGFRPRIERIILRQVETAVTVDALRTGEIDLISNRGGADVINPALDLVAENIGFTYTSFPRDGYGLIRFHGDARPGNPLQFTHVRQAVTLLTDREDLGRQFTGGHAAFVHGPYALSQWMYLENRDALYARIDFWDFNPQRAEQLLIDNGWTLNAAGEEVFTTLGSANGQLRHKDTEFGLMPLTIEWLASTGNPVSDLIAILLPPRATEAGMQINETRVGSVLPAASRSGEHADDPQFFMFNMGTGFGVPFSPWISSTTNPSFFGTSNPNFFGCEILYGYAVQMRLTPPGDYDRYAYYWLNWVERWNYLLPDMPLYADIFFDFKSDRIGGWINNSTWTWASSITRAYVR